MCEKDNEDIVAMTEAPELFDDVFVYVLQFERMAQQQQNAFQPSYEQVRENIKQSLVHAKMAADNQHMQEAEFDEARFAVEAWADELILKHRAWKHYDTWANNPLVSEDYRNIRAGVEFFDRLARLPTNQHESRKIYHRCLALGFSGRYVHDKSRLAQLRHDLAHQLSVEPSEVQGVDKLTPQPYTTLSLTAVPAPSLWLYRLRTASRLLLIAAPLMLLVIKLIIASPPALLDLRTPIEATLRPYRQPCTKITADVIEPAGRVALAGRVPHETHRHTIASDVQKVPGVRLFKDKLEVIPRPACEVLDLLEPFQTGPASGMSVTLKKGLPDGNIIAVDRANPLYSLDDNLVIEVEVPFGSYVYIDYYDTKERPPSFGEVTHLFPSSFASHNLKQPHVTFMIGDPAGAGQIKIGLPAGRDLVTVIASKSPLLAVSDLVAPGASLKAEPAEGYLARLRQALQGVAKSDVMATFAFLHNSGENHKP
jgi:type IV/VI secretion system ImpK/VasF family protein